MNRRHFITLAAGSFSGALVSCGKKSTTGAAGKPIIRFGHLPNLTHVQALVARHLSRQGKGWYEQRLDSEIEWFSYNAGPSAVEAIFAKSLDVTYIGPSPVLNAYAKSKGAEMRVLAGAANGGSALLVRPDSGIQTPADFRGKRIATPQLGNTQDVQARAWLNRHGIRVTQSGGDASVIPTQNADQIGLFQRKELDAVWTVEPWATRLEIEAGAKVFLEDKETNVTLLAARAEWLIKNHELAKKLAAAHRELTTWVLANPAETRALVKAELTALKLPPSDVVLDRALRRVVITDVISRQSLEQMVASAKTVGFLTEIPPLDALIPHI
jgi:NitT/TauT family transport system substrate-binding protein